MNGRKTRDDEIYEQGVHDGQQADALDQFSHNLVKNYTFNPRNTEIYNKGYEYGLAHRPQPIRATDNQPSTNGGASSGSHTGSSGSESGGDSILDVGDGNPICALFAGIGALWGLVAGFQAGGFWGAFWGVVVGMLAGYLLGIAATLAIGGLILYCFFWIAWHIVKFLWNLG